jgi:16S rRNA (guanine527-N7)-methyltransferase
MTIFINNISELTSFCDSFAPVSHETANKISAYVDLLIKWQKKINLVSPNTLNEVWHRHIADSAQLMALVSHENSIADIGTGAGFPGMVLAAFGCKVTLIEVDQRKCAFLNEVAMHCRINVRIENKSIASFWGEDVGGGYDYVSARALAPIANLLEYSEPALVKNSKCIFMKGAGAEEELTLANQSWHINSRVIPSLTEPKAAIVLIDEAKRRDR